MPEDGAEMIARGRTGMYACARAVEGGLHCRHGRVVVVVVVVVAVLEGGLLQ